MEEQNANEPPANIEDADSARNFLRWCIDEIGLGFHPDTPFADYVDQAGNRCFQDDFARRLDLLNERVFEFCDPYEEALNEVRQRFLDALDDGKSAPEM